MANYAITTKVLVCSKVTNEADTVTGSLANIISTYFETITNSFTIHSIQMFDYNGQTIVVIMHNNA